MSEPEIARRCFRCGASVRQHAAFCPQCGQDLHDDEVRENEQPQLHSVDSVPAFVEEPSTDAVDDVPSEPQPQMTTEPVIVRRYDEGPEQTDGEAARTQPLIVNRTQVSETKPQTPDVHLPRRQPDQPAGRLGGPRRAVLEDQVLGRVEKIRKVSSVMIDQAAYDPSMRFLLVAALLFLMFVVLMILSKVIG